MTGYWNAYKLDILMQLTVAMAMAIGMAMAMVMISSKRNPPSMPPSQDVTHTMIGGVTEIAVSNSDNNRDLVQVTSTRLDGRMLDFMDVEICRTVSVWMFLLSLFSSLLFSSLLHGSRPSTNVICMAFYHLWGYVKMRWSFPMCWIH